LDSPLVLQPKGKGPIQIASSDITSAIGSEPTMIVRIDEETFAWENDPTRHKKSAIIRQMRQLQRIAQSNQDSKLTTAVDSFFDAWKLDQRMGSNGQFPAANLFVRRGLNVTEKEALETALTLFHAMDAVEKAEQFDHPGHCLYMMADRRFFDLHKASQPSCKKKICAQTKNDTTLLGFNSGMTGSNVVSHASGFRNGAEPVKRGTRPRYQNGVLKLFQMHSAIRNMSHSLCYVLECVTFHRRNLRLKEMGYECVVLDSSTEKGHSETTAFRPLNGQSEAQMLSDLREVCKEWVALVRSFGFDVEDLKTTN
jgi:hypothetical protein